MIHETRAFLYRIFSFPPFVLLELSSFILGQTSTEKVLAVF